MKRWLLFMTALGLAAFACSSEREGSTSDPGSIPPFGGDSGSDGSGIPLPRGVVLIHAAAFPSFRLCFENYPELRPQPDSEVMPNANVVGVEVGSAVRIAPLTRAPGRVFVIDRREAEASPGEKERLCGSLICDREGGAHDDGCLRPGQDYDEIAAIQKPLGTERVELLTVAGCANGLVLSNLGVEPSVCGDGWQFKSGGLRANVLELSPRNDLSAGELSVQLVHLSPMAEAASIPGSLHVTFGPLASGAIERQVAGGPPLFAAAPEQTLAVDREASSFYGAYGFRIALEARPIVDAGASEAGDGGELSATSSILVEQSLAEIQDLSAPREVPANYYRAASSYALLLLGDPAITKTIPEGKPNPAYNARRGLHLLALPILDPNAGTDGTSSEDDSTGASR